ncbi:MAG: glycine--tRNA ligase [Candidatus Vogelbacteria bacterium CG22_combo_CG10-13_8_21_14_all_37_9]|uniref:Glycine--tRNA ligase n=1 Tax=Candidatus Vogelbacteria bacterium CG22_combo_CG10-13_8_21_14_all_37_9 TaxID=1975046 RepID=A0A2H0BKA0_9BACT|nr:MAG: glycine--tRNA ligase [bacterium CG10_37_50]PIP58103.1 MAG: glycine--tRNA ligase [Candidatus Vogelbacteria bacterium CG22_combo_CG10-13_8_21_14_all_37_9]
MTEKNNDSLEKIVSLCKRRGFIYPSSEIYGGLAGAFDFGPLGVELKNNLKNIWWQMFVHDREDMYGLDASILMNSKVWEASGHLAGFADPLVECQKCHSKFRADQIGFPVENMKKGVSGSTVFILPRCPNCNSVDDWNAPTMFNMMFQTTIGAEKDSSATVYLRPETAQGIFTDFKNVLDSFHPKLPFGIAQIGKAFRNEISPRDFVFRVRELEQMEIEYFVREADWVQHFETWRQAVHEYLALIGVAKEKVHELEVSDEERAHYSKRTIDFEFDYPFGRKELYGLAYRTDYDLTHHQEKSNQDLNYYDEETKEHFIPHVIEPSFGVERTVLAVLLSAYREDELGGEKRNYLAFEPRVAPIKVAVFPLLKNKPDLVTKARSVFSLLKKDLAGQIIFDDNGNIGKRYRRQDEIGTPWCVTIDFDTLDNDTVTVRDRDTGEQRRLAISELGTYFRQSL